jgi:uncharacterized protein YndB with AHSA1/START domain/DNA-binding transcriptional ArsR family regulator
MTHEPDPELDPVFRALAEPSRRVVLDLLKARPGMAVGDLAAHFDVTRFAVMKHVRVLEEAGLVVSLREGRRKRLYLNAVPIQAIHDRWLSRYSALFARRLTSLKIQLEEGFMAEQALRHVYVVYIQTTPEKLWDAITKPELSRQYFHGTDVRSDFRPGSTIEYLFPEENGERKQAIVGEIVEVEPMRRLVHTFSFPSNADPHTRVTWELEPMGEIVKVTLVHDDFTAETETYNGVKEGWLPIISGLKTLLETGKPMPFPAMATS